MPLEYLNKQVPSPPPPPEKHGTKPLRQKVDIPNLRPRPFAEGSDEYKVFKDSNPGTELLRPAVIESPHRRPFSPTAVVAKSGKTIKAFFRHRHGDSLRVVSATDSLVQGDTKPTPAYRRRSAQANEHEGFNIPMVTSKSSVARRPSGRILGKSQLDNRSVADASPHVMVDFPRMGKKRSADFDAVFRESLRRRQPRRSLSFFQNALKAKAVTKVASPPPRGNAQDARVPLETLRRQGPVSRPGSGLSFVDSNRPYSNKPEKPRPPSRLSVAQQVEGNLGPITAEGPLLSLKIATSSAKARQHSLSVRENLSSGAALYSASPDDLEVEIQPVPQQPVPQLSPVISSQPAITAITVNLQFTPDQEAHYMLRMACTYLTKTILPELKMARKHAAPSADAPSPSTTRFNPALQTASEKANALRSHVRDKIKVIERMEKAWGIEWMLRGKDGFVISDARKESERDSFRRAIDDGVLVCL